MAKFVWDDSVALGIHSIDEQHKALFGWVNALNDSVKRGDGSKEVEGIIWKLITYVSQSRLSVSLAFMERPSFIRICILHYTYKNKNSSRLTRSNTFQFV